MVRHKAYQKLGGRGSLGPGELGTVLDVDVEMQAGGRVKVQGPRTTYWYDMEELGGAYEGPPDPACAHFVVGDGSRSTAEREVDTLEAVFDEAALSSPSHVKVRCLSTCSYQSTD